MFSPRKTSDQSSWHPGPLMIVLAVLISLSLVTQWFSSGMLPIVFLGGVALFALWWVYTKLFKKKQESELEKYRKAVHLQKKKKIAIEKAQEKGKVIYLKDIRPK